MTHRPPALLRRLTGGDDAHVDELPEGAREVWRRNYALQLVARVLSKVGDVLASPRTVLPWLLAASGAPAWTAGALTPLREAGSLLPQAPLGAWIGRLSHRKGVWVAGTLLEAASVGVIAFVAGRAGGTTLGLTAVGVMIVFSLARAGASLSSKDLLGRTVPRGRRGRLTGTSASLAGALSLAAGLGLGFSGMRAEADGLAEVRVLLVVAALGWLASALAMSRVHEAPANTDGQRSVGEGLALLREDPVFRRFVMARGLLAGTVLAMPTTVLLMRETTGNRLEALGLVVIAASAARMISGAVWGGMADRSSRHTLAVAGAVASLVMVGIFVLGQIGITGALGLAAWTTAFFLLGLAHTGIRTGRKTYVVDLADDDRRPLYVGIANTLMGVVLLGSTALSALASLFSPGALILLLATLGGAGAVVAATLPEIDELRREDTDA